MEAKNIPSDENRLVGSCCENLFQMENTTVRIFLLIYAIFYIYQNVNLKTPSKFGIKNRLIVSCKRNISLATMFQMLRNRYFYFNF